MRPEAREHPGKADPAVVELLAAAEVWDLTLRWVPSFWQMSTLARYKRAGFTQETLPIRMQLSRIEPTAEGRAWIDAHHAEVARLVEPQLEGAAKAGLPEATRPLG